MADDLTSVIERGGDLKEYVEKCAEHFYWRHDNAKDTEMYEKYVRDARAKLEAFKNSTPEQKRNLYVEYVRQKWNYINENEKIDRERDFHYTRMKELVDAWVLPSEEHKKLKDFMLEKISNNRPLFEYYEEETTRLSELTFDSWLLQNEESLEWSLKFYLDQMKKYLDETSNTKTWTKLLNEAFL